MSLSEPNMQIQRHKIVTRLRDGLGNQLFQYAVGRALAERLNTELILDCGWFQENGDRVFGLDSYSIDAVRNWNFREVRSTWIKFPTRLGKQVTHAVHERLPTKIEIDGHTFKVTKEKQFYKFDKHIERLSGSIYLDGFWQSPKYFESSSKIIRKELKLKTAPPEPNREWLHQIKRAKAVSVHVRRGDYLLSNDRWTCSKGYYDKAMQFIRSHIGDAHFFIFSDDSGWCRDNFSSPDVTVVYDGSDRNAVDDLDLMAACHHHIIANSSFSWWGAWLADSPDQIVIAPEYWVVGIRTTDDFVSERWKRFHRF